MSKPMMTRVLVVAMATCALVSAGKTADHQPPASPVEGANVDGNAVAVTATYLLNLAWFVSWPDSALADEETPFRVGVMGPEDLVAGVTRLAENSVVRRRPVVVQSVEPGDALDAVHILFIAGMADEEGRRARVLAELAGRPVLTVGDSEDFIRQGGHIRFTTGRSATSLQINRSAAERVGLRISSKLLSLAEVVTLDETAEKD